jgi:hypothetical protein
MAEKNEFDSLDEDVPPAQEYVDKEEGLIASNSAGVKYDWHTAPDRLKAPPRVDLNGKEITITDAEIILPAKDKPWLRTRKGQQEFYSGIRVFKAEGEKYSHPSVTRDGKTQASALLMAYADFKKKSIDEVTLKEFMGYLTSKPKAIITSVEVENPINHTKLKKNLVSKFI